MLHLGRARDHSPDTYRFMNLESKKVINSRDATWMNQAHGVWKKLHLPTTPDIIAVLPAILDVETGQELTQKGALAKATDPQARQ